MAGLADALMGPPAPAAEEGGGDLVLAGEDLAKAIKSGDGQMIADAFRAMKELCEAEAYPEPAPTGPV